MFYPARDFLDSLAMRIWEARREGALIGCLCTLSVIWPLYVAFLQYGQTHPVSALCYGGVAVVLAEAYVRLVLGP